ncbi:hypothetical protein [Chamaesiphon polymorphus]|uniref:Magnetosome protein MamS/MamX domain-containing protein n=1 Tax=Chamaesiphon polymorphus CCALA 037 TaxID=2107692 RepID=A0A2T1GKS3_9CYAN|nr:hypothetical protein [Chamaesiphon polymorphus]PSB58367.1 hypothetical protein C7B77_05040 [Chamaesiphon polymorphus CCALA 037]
MSKFNYIIDNTAIDFRSGAASMKRMTTALLLVISMGWMAPGEVRAEAPTPTRGCWSREIATRPSVDPQTITTIKGRVIAIERNDKNQPVTAKQLVTWAQVKTDRGEVKSVYLGADKALNKQNLKVKVNDVVEVQGVQMPQAQQPTILANSVKKGDRVWKIANFITKPTSAKSC